LNDLPVSGEEEKRKRDVNLGARTQRRGRKKEGGKPSTTLTKKRGEASSGPIHN